MAALTMNRVCSVRPHSTVFHRGPDALPYVRSTSGHPRGKSRNAKEPLAPESTRKSRGAGPDGHRAALRHRCGDRSTAPVARAFSVACDRYPALDRRAHTLRPAGRCPNAGPSGAQRMAGAALFHRLLTAQPLPAQPSSPSTLGRTVLGRDVGHDHPAPHVRQLALGHVVGTRSRLFGIPLDEGVAARASRLEGRR